MQSVPTQTPSDEIAPESVAIASQSTLESGDDLRISISPTSSARVYLSIVVPAFNEEQRLPATLQRMAEYLATRDFSFELIVVDDGSRDQTRQVVRDFIDSHSWVRLLQYDDAQGRAINRGKGFAVRQGILHAQGRDVLFSDADLSTPIEELEKLLPPISRGDCDISIASRALPESKLSTLR